jgi:UDP-N-acetylmuramate dehydrogenase
MKDFARKLGKHFRGRLKLNEPLAPHTSFGIGGRADLWAEPAAEEDIHVLLELLGAEGIPFAVFGNGTNFLVKDGGFRGAVISMRRFAEISFSGEVVSAGAGALLSAVLRKTAERGLSGLEFGAGIPAAAGGAAASNAGGRFGDMKRVLKSVLVWEDGGFKTIPAAGLGLEYRKSGLKEKKAVIIETELALKEESPDAVRGRILDIMDYRRKAQPLNARSAGCIFKNPQGMSAGVMISSIGLSGRSAGGAEISVKHANYIINRGRASASDVISLIELVEEEVQRFYNVKLEREVEIIGE